MGTPLFRHGRVCCKYLGRVSGPGPGGEADAYFCPHVKTLVVRFGDGPDEYVSSSHWSRPHCGPLAEDPRLAATLELAVAQGWVLAPEPAR